MTGTALTEATEFMKIYKLRSCRSDNRRCPRGPQHQVYKTKEGKWSAVDARSPRATRPAAGALGTISVEVSELLSARLHRANRARGAQREARVRRARRRHDRRAAVWAPSRSRPTAAVASTSSWAEREHQRARAGQARPAPRRTWFEEHFVELLPRFRRASTRMPARDRGRCLYIVGTERHESRRIDNQLRGRSGPQGDPARAASSSPPRTT